MSYLRVEHVEKSFGENRVLKDISFSLPKGSFLSLLGPSGCGKTTMLKIIVGLESPDKGRVFLGGRELTPKPTEQRNIGMMFQNYALFPNMTVARNIAYGLKIRKRSQAEIDEKVDWALKLVKLEGRDNDRVTLMSGGQQQRVALARALVIQPDMLLLDEPLSALDRKIRVEMQYEIRSIQRQVGITTVFVTHDQEEALTMSDAVILMNDGRIEQWDDPWTMYNQPASVFASGFIGKANILDGRLVEKNGLLTVEGPGWSFPVNERDGFKPGDAVTVAIRGEHFHIDREPGPGAVPFKIKDTVFTGSVRKINGFMGADEVQLVALNSSEAAVYAPGQELTVSTRPQYVHYYARVETR
ncbi:MAG: ABC transporter ATP-binding protein [Candidatus Adiutrix sp.]|jgi:ABC-type Fe3+/spermidine/putrescine transport system ATPase subunit|nr:ABC transporter ATP-binding protein [Candidatus Adiutrix sp.]